MSAKILEMPKSKAQWWSELFRGRKNAGEIQKYNQRESDAMFAGFINQIDRRQAQLAEKASGHVGEDGGWIPDESA